MGSRSLVKRLEDLEKQAGKGRQALAVVDGREKSQEEVDLEVAQIRAAGHTGIVIIIDF